MQRIRQCTAFILLLCFCTLIIVLAGCTSSSIGNGNTFASTGKRYEGHLWSLNGQWLIVEGSELDTLSLFDRHGQLVQEFHLGCDLGNGVEDVSWLADGDLSCYIANEPPTLAIFQLDTHGGIISQLHIPIPIPAGKITFGSQWNPHHNWFATLVNLQTDSIINTLYISDDQGRELLMPQSTDATDMAWSPDGNILALNQKNGDVGLWQVQKDEIGHLYLHLLRRLTAGTTVDEPVSWSPSGHWLVCRHGDYRTEDYLFLLATDGSGKRIKITSSFTDGQLAFPAFSSDGSELTVTRISYGTLVSLSIKQIMQNKKIPL